MSETSPAQEGILRFHRALRPGFGTESAVYGTILVSGLIAVASTKDETSVAVLITVAVTVVVFWGAHVFAGVLARFGDHEHRESGMGLRAAFRASLRESLGLLTSSAVPALILLAGTTRIIPDGIANYVALWSGVVILGFLGYVAFLRRRSPLVIRILGTLATASFGLVFVILKALVH
ncbi:hypothetical protein N1031_10740 [Herbiconiux moechotypicola]|nr:hypothetical protein [Herbiconiux moechotypicola]MCS5730237.1 hypothetical protein [Herbiconiux moechotypicola]